MPHINAVHTVLQHASTPCPKMNISEKELYDRIKSGRVKRPIKDGRKNYWLNSYLLACILHEEDSILTPD
ncbi:hypothetical protein GBN67_10315 [Acinetobacter johnsonii]|nr:hypothetical protein GBN67_10315 [Acinetobacter johnsonii]